jgi:hypothetical protein
MKIIDIICAFPKLQFTQKESFLRRIAFDYLHLMHARMRIYAKP